MRKTVFLSMAIVLAGAVFSFGKGVTVTAKPAADAALNTTPTALSAEKPVVAASQDMGWMLLGTDVVLAGISAYLLIDERKAGDDYDKLFNQIDNTDAESYKLLLDKKKEGEAKALQTGIASGITAAFIGYTLLDFLWLHIIFKDEVKAVFDISRQEMQVTWNRSF